MKRIAPLALIALSACTTDRPTIIKPPAEYLASVEEPKLPPPEATCDDGSKCLSDLQAGNVTKELIKALREANAKLAELRAWFGE